MWIKSKLYIDLFSLIRHLYIIVQIYICLMNSEIVNKCQPFPTYSFISKRAHQVDCCDLIKTVILIMILFWFLSIVVFLLGIWSALRYRNGYWKRRGIPFIPATVVVGNFKEVCNFSTPLVEQFRSWYNHPVGKDSPVVGIHLFYRPALLIRDLDLVKAVLLKDFAAFSNRYWDGKAE